MGIFHWGWFCNFGKLHHKILDWQKFHVYFEVIKNALSKGTIPYYFSYEFKGTNKFLALPETDLSPHVLLLNYLTTEEFVLAALLIMYSIGFWGCYLIQKHFRLSLIAFFILFAMFNFNGYITSHLAMGHWPWVSYFYLPFFMLFVFRWVEGERSPDLFGKIAVVMFFVLLQGGLHIFVFCLLFISLFGVLGKQNLKDVFLICGMCVLLGGFRLVPAAYAFWGYKHDFMIGFPSLISFIESMVVVKDFSVILPFEPILSTKSIDYIGWWELDYFIGVLGFGFLVYFGIIAGFQQSFKDGRFDKLYVPIIGLTILSFGFVLAPLAKMSFPLISVERFPSRFFILPILMLLIISLVRFQKLLDRNPLRLKWDWIPLVLVLMGVLQLLEHSAMWQVSIMESFNPVFYLEKFKLSIPVQSEVSRSYFWVLCGGYLLSGLSLLIFAVYKYRQNLLFNAVKSAG